MSSNSLVNQDKFWTVLSFLMKLKTKVSLHEIESQFSLPRGEINTYLTFLEKVSFRFRLELESPDDEPPVKYYSPMLEQKRISLDFSLFEWLEFQAHFPYLSEASGEPFHRNIINKIALLEDKFPEHDLFEPIETMEKIMHNRKPTAVCLENGSNSNLETGFIQFIEESILDKKSLNLQLEKSVIQIFPLTLIYLEGELAIVGESVSDNTLQSIPLSRISSLAEDDEAFEATHSKKEVEGFVIKVRGINDSETRLVLKINGLVNFESSIPYNFLGKPAMISNPEGDLIWGATVENNIEIFNWLYNLGSDVEILDPTNFKKDFLLYCENLLEKLA